MAVFLSLDSSPRGSLSSEGNQRIRPTRTARREESRSRGGEAEDEHGGADDRRIGRVESGEKAREQPRHRDRRGDAARGAERPGPAELYHPIPDNSRAGWT